MMRCIHAILFCLFLSSHAFGEDLLFINRPVANLHKTPNANDEVVSQAIYATKVAFLEKGEKWSKIETPDKYQGWVSDEALIKRESAYPNKTETIGKVKNLYAHIYLVEDTSPHPPKLTLPFDSFLEVASPIDALDKRWIQIRLLDGSLVYIQKGDLSINPKPINQVEMLALSKKFLGLPYTWGGASSFGFDCSGFVQTLFRQMGIKLPRDSKDQYAFSEAIDVEKKNIEPGDLLFFGPGGVRVTHVGLYLGNDQFIHSTVQDNPILQISNLNEPVWIEKYVGAKRIGG